MRDASSLDELWRTAPAPYALFDVARIAIVPGTPLANAVRLRMHGEIKLRGWYPFTAEQVIRWDRGMIWRATVEVHGLPIRGGDSFLDGEGAMRWRLFGLVPIITAEGADITRSAAGRAHVESIWLPSVLCADDVRWSERDAVHP